MRPLVISHARCLDGAGAALAAYMKFGDDAEYLFTYPSADAPPDEQVSGRDVYLLDICFRRAEVERLIRAASSVAIVDHHVTSRDACGDLPGAHFDLSHSGAVLAWRHFHPEPPGAEPGSTVPELLQHVEDRDLWRWRMERSRAVTDALYAHGAAENFRVMVEMVLNWHGDDWRARLFEEGRAIGMFKDAAVSQICGSAREVYFPKFKLTALAANTSILQSEVAGELAKRHPPLGVAWFREHREALYIVSLRSVPGLDVTPIAVHYGGGGHPQAAGFSIKASLFSLSDELPFYEVLC